MEDGGWSLLSAVDDLFKEIESCVLASERWEMVSEKQQSLR